MNEGAAFDSAAAREPAVLWITISFANHRVFDFPNTMAASLLGVFVSGGATMKNPVDLHIGQCVRHRRWLQGMTQQQLGQAIGIRFQQVQKYESGGNRISAAMLWRIAHALDVGVSFFFSGLDDPTRSLLVDGCGEEALQQKETMDLVRAYYAMEEGPRRRLLELIKTVSQQGSRDNKEADQTVYTL